MAIRDLATGENRLLTHSAGEEREGGRESARPASEEKEGHTDGPVVPSPDGKLVAFEWNDSEVRIIGIDGSNDRIVMPDVNADFVWSPDGRQLAVQLSRPSDDNRIVLVSVANGSTTRLKSTGWQRLMLGGFSPDGRWLTYAAANSQGKTDGGIFSIAVDGSGETPLVQGPSNHTSPMWTPDGSAVVFRSNRSGIEALWSVRVAQGKSPGPPELVRPSFNGRPMGFSRDGSYPDTFTITKQPVRLSDRSIGGNTQPVWSPDGRSIAFIRTRPGAGPGTNALVVRSVADGVERTLTTAFQSLSGWFPDSRSLVVSNFGNRATGLVTFKRVEVETGKESVVFELPYPGTYGKVGISPDTKTVYYSRRDNPARTLHLMRRDIETGEESDLYRLAKNGSGAFYGLALSPDGSQLSFVADTGTGGSRALLIISTNGGTPRKFQPTGGECPFSADTVWTTNSRHILAVCRSGSRNQVWAFPLAGGEPRKIDVTTELIPAFSPSPDGRQIVFEEQQRRKPEVWTIKNLFPAARAGR